MAQTVQVTDFIKNVKASSKPFQPYAYYGKEEDALKVYFSDEQDYAKRLNSRVTVYLSLETDEIVGVQIKNVRQVLEDIGSYDIAIQHGKLKVQLLFLAMRGEIIEHEQDREFFRKLGAKASEAAGLELDVSNAC